MTVSLSREPNHHRALSRPESYLSTKKNVAENQGRFNPYGAQTTTAGGTPTAATQNPYTFKGGIQDRATG